MMALKLTKQASTHIGNSLPSGAGRDTSRLKLRLSCMPRGELLNQGSYRGKRWNADRFFRHGDKSFAMIDVQFIQDGAKNAQVYPAQSLVPWSHRDEMIESAAAHSSATLA
jgi:hypothetical protein